MGAGSPRKLRTLQLARARLGMTGALEHRQRAIDAREHLLFPENFEEMI